MQRIIAATAVLAASVFLSTPAAAQDTNERVNQLIIYGDDPCPQSSDAEITVCARKDEAERFRIPEPLRESTSPQNEAWSNRVVAYETVGRAGTLSCSPTGPGGSTGCLQQIIDTAYAERRASSDVRFSQLIAEERERRLATVDADAAETQARVEDAERDYEARQRAQAEADATASGRHPEAQEPPVPQN